MFSKKLFIDFIVSQGLTIPKEIQIPTEFQVSTDTRTIKPGDLYIALKGDNFDGANFCDQAIDAGASLTISSNPSSKNNISVPDSLLFFQDFARERIKEWKKLDGNNVVIGITGSNGKTTTKEMLYHLLAYVYGEKVHCTQGNFNNHIGVPLTINRLENSHTISIIEMGTNHKGEIKTLADIGLPDAGIITQIGDSHLEFLIDRAGVFEEKSALFHSVKKNKKKGVFVIDGEDPYLQKLKLDQEDVSVLVKNFQGDSIQTSETLENSNILGRHNFKNLSMAFELAVALFPKHKPDFINAAKTFRPKFNRSSWTEYDGARVFLDAYNANPSSMRASVESFVEFINLKGVPLKDVCFILGDMNELGENAHSFHKEIGELLKSLKVENAIFVGQYSDSYNSGFSKVTKQFNSAEELKNSFENSFPYLFVKGSRSLQLESIFAIN